MNTLKKHLWKKKLMKLKYLFVCLTGLGGGRVSYLRKHNVFGLMGENVLFQPTKLPNEPKLIKIHNNVKIASGVTFYTHDVINEVFATMDGMDYQTHGSCIEVFDNTFIGGNSIIIGNVKIGPNAIVAAGSIIVKDVPAGKIVGGNPAEVIGDFFELREKRRKIDGNKKGFDPNLRADEIWKDYYSIK